MRFGRGRGQVAFQFTYCITSGSNTRIISRTSYMMYNYLVRKLVVYDRRLAYS
jgi:hypothetical protein